MTDKISTSPNDGFSSEASAPYSLTSPAAQGIARDSFGSEAAAPYNLTSPAAQGIARDSFGSEAAPPYIDCYHGDYDETLMASSYTECTGLIPSAPLSEYEIEAYSDIYQFRPEGVRFESGR